MFFSFSKRCKANSGVFFFLRDKRLLSCPGENRDDTLWR